MALKDHVGGFCVVVAIVLILLIIVCIASAVYYNRFRANPNAQISSGAATGWMVFSIIMAIVAFLLLIWAVVLAIAAWGTKPGTEAGPIIRAEPQVIVGPTVVSPAPVVAPAPVVVEELPTNIRITCKDPVTKAEYSGFVKSSDLRRATLGQYPGNIVVTPQMVV